MGITPDVARRLALIRLLLARGSEMSSEPPPFSFDSINRLHDAAEMFLALAAQVHGVGIPRDFTGYWDALEPRLGRPLGYRAQMQKFNKARVNLKHYGVEPAASEIVDARVTVSSLLADECFALFGVGLRDVSLTSFVGCEIARQLLESAETAWATGDEEAAMADLADSFETLIRDYEQRKMIGHSVSVFDQTKDMTFVSSFFRGVQDRKQREFDDKVIESLKALDSAVMLLGLGVDFRRYGKFKALTPHLIRTLGGQRHAYARQGVPPASAADFEFCRDFVVNTAIHLADFDYDIEWSQGYRAAREQESGSTRAAEPPSIDDGAS